MKNLRIFFRRLLQCFILSLISLTVGYAGNVRQIMVESEESLIGDVHSSLPLCAESIDSTRVDSIVKVRTDHIANEDNLVSPKAIVVKEAWHPNSNLSMLFSAILPGGGQIYNRKYWKVPIVWGAFTACIYAITWNQNVYSGYKHAYIDLTSDDPMKKTSWQDYIAPGANPEEEVKSGALKERLKRGIDFYRRQRDLSLIVTAGVYLLNILDAYVDAELYQFDISPDLSMRVAPGVGTSPQGGLQYGIGCSLYF